MVEAADVAGITEKMWSFSGERRDGKTLAFGVYLLLTWDSSMARLLGITYPLLSAGKKRTMVLVIDDGSGLRVSLPTGVWYRLRYHVVDSGRLRCDKSDPYIDYRLRGSSLKCRDFRLSGQRWPRVVQGVF